jgi:hypothetical protein
VKTDHRIGHRVARIARRMPRRELRLLVPCFHLCVVACILIEIVLPGVRELRGGRTEYKAAQEELVGERDRRERIGEIRSRIVTLQRETRDLAPISTDAHGVHSVVRTTALTTGSKLKTFASMETEGEYLYAVEGAFDSALSFLEASIDTFVSFQPRRVVVRAVPSNVGQVELEALIQTSPPSITRGSRCADRK